jgi:hypothetical protein
MKKKKKASPSVAKRRTQFKKENRERKEYFRQYYSGERYEQQKEATKRDTLLKFEAGYLKKDAKEYFRHKRNVLMGRKIIIFVDGQKLVGWQYALKNLIRHLSQSTIKHYLKIGYIPQPPYRAKALNGYRKYYSMYQIRIINLCWQKKSKKGLKERVEQLHERWKKDPLLGGQSDDGNED